MPMINICRNKFAIVPMILVGTLLAGGCSKNRQNIRVDKSYNGHITEIYPKMTSSERLPHTISIRSKYGPKITPEHQLATARQVIDAMNEIRTIAPERIAKAFEANGLRVRESEDASKASLVISPHHVNSSTDQGIDSHDIWYQVILHDNIVGREVWSGEFKLFVFPTQYNKSGVFPDFIDRFAQTIVEQIAKDGLLQR